MSDAGVKQGDITAQIFVVDHRVTILVNSAGLHSLRKIKKSSHISAKLFERAALDVLAMI